MFKKVVYEQIHIFFSKGFLRKLRPNILQREKRNIF